MTETDHPEQHHQDDDESFVEGEEPPTHEQLARVGELVAAQEAVAAVEDPEERKQAARAYYAALAGEDPS